MDNNSGQVSTSAPTSSPASPEFVKLRDWLKETGISYSTYRVMRKQGKAPAEMRPTKRTILISRAATEAWRRGMEAPTGQQMSLNNQP